MKQTVITRVMHQDRLKLPVVILGLALGSLPLSLAQAVATGDSNAVSFHGTLKIHPCHINNDQGVSVHFGNVGIHKVDGQHYRQTVTYRLVCEDTDPSWRLTMAVKGTATSFDNTALSTSSPGLGIKILQNGQPVEINKSFDISYSNPPVLEAVPVRDPDIVDLTEGAFSTTATLLAEYL